MKRIELIRSLSPLQLGVLLTDFSLSEKDIQAYVCSKCTHVVPEFDGVNTEYPCSLRQCCKFRPHCFDVMEWLMGEYVPGGPFDVSLDGMHPDNLSMNIRDLYTAFEVDYKWEKATPEEAPHEPL